MHIECSEAGHGLNQLGCTGAHKQRLLSMCKSRIGVDSTVHVQMRHLKIQSSKVLTLQLFELAGAAGFCQYGASLQMHPCWHAQCLIML